MLGRVPYSKAQFWQTILVSFLLVVFNTPSCPAAALAADEAAAKEDKREAPAAAPVEDYADPEDELTDEDWLALLSQGNRFDKRGPSPRDLFKSAYSNYDKRAPNMRNLFSQAYGTYDKRAPNMRNLFSQAYGTYEKRSPSPRDLFQSAYGNYGKRANFRRNDPRSLFQAVYGNYGKRAPSPRDLFSSVYGSYGYNMPKRYGRDTSDEDYGLMNYSKSRRSVYKPNDPRSLFRSVYGYLK